MVAPTPGPLKTPRGTGFMSANMVLPLHEVLGERMGGDARDALFAEIGLRYLPEPEEPVRERLVGDLHHAVREKFPEDWQDIMRDAAERAADIIVNYRIPAGARTMLRRLPWPLATWMLMRSAQQHAWTFGGSARMVANKTAEFELTGNPSIRGEKADEPICVFHEALFQSLFRSLIHPRMSCVQLACEACGQSACRFSLTLSPGETA